MAYSGLHHAVMGCLVKDEDGQVFGVTCEHVTRVADGVFHIENEFGKLEQVGRSLQFRKDKIEHDIDIIELDKTLQTVLAAGCKDDCRNNIQFKLYKGKVSDLYDREVFQYCVGNQSDDSFCIRGRVCDAGTHEKHSDLINISHNFIVEGHDVPFAKEGDSGRLVAIHNENKSVDIVGIITAGKFELKFGEISQKTSLCLLLSSGLKVLSKYYKKKLRLHDKSLSLSRNSFQSVCLKYGGIIWFKTPEQIKQPDFDLCERLEMLTACFTITEQNDNVQMLVNFEIEMSNKVFCREDVTSNEYSFNNSDQNCVFNSMLACQYLYEKRFKETERHLKTACRMVSCRSRFPIRLLCKVISYVTWMLLDMDKLDEMKSLLDAGLEFMEETRHCKSFPTESIGYQFYDYARYYLKKQQVQEAAQMAKRSVEYFTEEKRSDVGSPNRLILAVSQFALIKLGCGEEFETCDQQVSQEDINEAEEFLAKVHQIADDQPSVQLTDYLLALSDLYFRKGNLTKALETTKKCLTIAQEKNLEDEIHWSRKRIEKLCDLNQIEGLATDK